MSLGTEPRSSSRGVLSVGFVGVIVSTGNRKSESTTTTVTTTTATATATSMLSYQLRGKTEATEATERATTISRCLLLLPLATSTVLILKSLRKARWLL